MRDLDRYVSIRERDIDLVVCLAAASVGNFWRLFRDSDEAPRTQHSVSDVLGEIDIVLAWEDHTVHVENKIDAQFQPEQAARYQKRGELSASVTTVLLAPQKYIDAHPTDRDRFDAVVSYEDLRVVLLGEGSGLATEMALVVQHAIEQHRRGRVAIESEGRTQFFNDFAERASEVGLPFVNTGPRGPRAGFFYVHRWEEVSGLVVELVAKFDHGAFDIQIAGAGHLMEKLIEVWGEEEITIRSTAVGTLIISQSTARLDPDLPMYEQQDALGAVLRDGTALLEWWQERGRSEFAALLLTAE